MSTFLERLDHELAGRGVRRTLRRRIALEYADHLACDPESETQLGDPGELAGEFAAELAADEARRMARNAFMELALAALALVAGQLTIAAAGGYPGYNHGVSTALAVPTILTLLIAPQIALVAGSLAALRALRTRGSRRNGAELRDGLHAFPAGQQRNGVHHGGSWHDPACCPDRGKQLRRTPDIRRHSLRPQSCRPQCLCRRLLGQDQG